MSNSPSNHDLHIMLVKLDGKTDALLNKLNDIKVWQEHHEETDLKRFRELNTKLDGMSRYAASVAVVAGGIGFFAQYIWDWLRRGA